MIEFVNKNFKNDFIFTITTNGTLLTKERIKFLKDNNIEVLLSLDGNKNTQDYNRPMKNKQSSFDIITKILPELQKNFSELIMRATIYEDTVSELFNNYLFAINNNFFSVNFIPDERHPWKKENYEILKNEIKKIYLFTIRYFLTYNKLPIHSCLFEQSMLRILKQDKNKNLDIF